MRRLALDRGLARKLHFNYVMAMYFSIMNTATSLLTYYN